MKRVKPKRPGIKLSPEAYQNLGLHVLARPHVLGEGRGSLPQCLKKYIPGKDRIVSQVPRPKATRFAQHPKEPFQTRTHHPPGCLGLDPGVKIETFPNSNQYRSNDLPKVRSRPIFFPCRSQADPHDIGAGRVNHVDDLRVFILCEGPERRSVTLRSRFRESALEVARLTSPLPLVAIHRKGNDDNRDSLTADRPLA